MTGHLGLRIAPDSVGAIHFDADFGYTGLRVQGEAQAGGLRIEPLPELATSTNPFFRDLGGPSLSTSTPAVRYGTVVGIQLAQPPPVKSLARPRASQELGRARGLTSGTSQSQCAQMAGSSSSSSSSSSTNPNNMKKNVKLNLALSETLRDAALANRSTLSLDGFESPSGKRAKRSEEKEDKDVSRGGSGFGGA